MQASFFSEEETRPQEYQVLARKYRPHTFHDMIGQDVLIRTVTNAINSERIAHAFILTGIRGVGKTTTARIIAKALNCIGVDGNGKPTPNPCGVCTHCKAISEGRSQDVLEMDAASHTGVNDIREIIENSRYRPVSTRYKIYIIDEVHMLSNSAFNALLKTLEEPPAHVKFIFATTEIRKIPITILSRCQRFDLKRVDASELRRHFSEVISKEGFKSEENAVRLIANVAGGSVRDGLSILDQALALSKGHLTENIVREMLGLADVEHIYNLYEHLLKGQIKETLILAKELFAKGADPLLVLQDLLKINHTVAKLKNSDNEFELAELELARCTELASQLDMPYIARSWQMMLKGLEEVKTAFDPYASFEMVLIRLAFAASLPTPEEVLRNMSNDAPIAKRADNSNEPSTSIEATRLPKRDEEGSKSNHSILNFNDVLSLLYNSDEMMLYHQLKNDVQFVKLEGQKLSLKLLSSAAKNLPQILTDMLYKLTQQKWSIIAASEAGQDTVAEQEKKTEALEKQKISEHPAVQQILNTFTDMEIIDIKTSNAI
jgi:DNA polymerase III subunit gamma/tau